MITIYHNPRCSKSRDCLAFIETTDRQFQVIKYLEMPLTYMELKQIIKKLHIRPIDLVRQKEDVWMEKFEGKNSSDRQLIQAMVKYPILMERPIAVNGNKAVIARPFERIHEII